MPDYSIPLPLPELFSDIEPLTENMLPDTIRDYIFDIAERQQCPVDFVAVSALCGLSALLGRKALIYPKQNDNWLVTPNLWGLLIGRPSTMKSPAMKAALEPLHNIEDELARLYKNAIDKYSFDKEYSEVSRVTRFKAAKDLIKRGKDEDAKEVIRNALFNEDYPKRKRIIINDTSVEKLGEILNENPNGVIHIRDEFSGWISKISKEEYQQDRSFYIECFDGNGKYTYDRIGRGHLHIENLTLSLLGGIQPSRIKPVIKDAVSGTGNDGLIQRLQLAVWPLDIKSWRWIDKSPNLEAYNRYKTIFQKFFNLSSKPQLYFRFLVEAQKIYAEWMINNHGSASSDTHPALESHFLKMPKTIASLALIFEILIKLSNDDMNQLNEVHCIVDTTAVNLAIRWAQYLKSHAYRVYGGILNPNLEGAHIILARFDKLEDSFTLRDIQRKNWIGLNDNLLIQDSLNYLVDYGYLISTNIPTTDNGGRPTTHYHKHLSVSKNNTKLKI